MIKNNKYFVDQINSSKAFKMTSYYHYSGTGFRKSILNLGIFRLEDNKLVGVLQWGSSFQDSIRLDRYVKDSITKDEYLELNRFCMADSELKNSESQAISLGIKWIKKNMPQIRLLVSYAGRKEGNYGYIYQATNWEYLGYFVSPGFWSVDGIEKHMITLWNIYSKQSVEKEGMTSFIQKIYEDVRQTWTKQFIYIQRLDKTLTPGSDVLPYPKPDTDYPIKTKEKIYKENNDIYNNPKKEIKKEVNYYYEKDKLLFTRATLKRRGLIASDNRAVVVYDSNGKFEIKYNNLKEVPKSLYAAAQVRNVIDQDKMYKKKYFRFLYEYEDVAEEIDIPYICIIDEIPFSTYVEAGEYLGVSKQSVHQSRGRNSKKIAGKEIIWGTI